ESQEDRHRSAACHHRSARAVGPGRCRLRRRSGSDQRHRRLLGQAALVPALCPPELRPRQADAARHQHARRGGMAGPAKERDWVAGWARRNRCGTKPVESGVAPDVTRIEYTRCAGDATVVLYTIQGGGHSWPGGKPLPEWWVGPTSRGIDATSQMWTFFREHQLLRK